MKLRTPIVAFTSAFVILATLVPLFVVFNNREADRKRDTYVTNYDDTSISSFEGLEVEAYMTAIDPKNCEVKVHFELYSRGKYVPASNDPSAVSQNITIIYGSVSQLKIEANKRMLESDLKMALSV